MSHRYGWSFRAPTPSPTKHEARARQDEEGSGGPPTVDRSLSSLARSSAGSNGGRTHGLPASPPRGGGERDADLRASVVLPSSAYVVRNDLASPVKSQGHSPTSSGRSSYSRREAELARSVQELQYLLSDSEVQKRELMHEVEARERVVAEAQRSMRRHYDALDRKARDLEARYAEHQREHSRMNAQLHRQIESLQEERAALIKVIAEASSNDGNNNNSSSSNGRRHQYHLSAPGDIALRTRDLRRLAREVNEPATAPPRVGPVKSSDIGASDAADVRRTLQYQLREAKADLERALAREQELEAKLNSNEAAESLMVRLEEAERRAESLEQQLREESLARKRIHNELRELRGNIRVIARIRPALSGSSSSSRSLSISDEYTCELSVSPRGHNAHAQRDELRRYEFDACLGEESTQDDVYAEVGDVVQSALDGYKVCVFAYGQTGSGKTFTMVGTDDQPGLLPRCVEQLFTGGDTAGVVTVRVHVLELYQDTLVDLLCASPGSGKGPNVRRDAATGDVSVEGAEAVTAEDAFTLLGVCRDAFKRRATASTKMNSESSRSHLLLMFQTEHVAHNTGARSRGKLTLVDLAGSERVKKSGSEGKLLDEAKAINASLSALGDVVSALTKNEKHIPYRNHRLTQLMSDSLGGQAKTLMIVNVSPLGEDGGETKNSLDYASRVKLVTNEASRSVETKAVLALKREVEELTRCQSLPSVSR